MDDKDLRRRVWRGHIGIGPADCIPLCVQSKPNTFESFARSGSEDWRAFSDGSVKTSASIPPMLTTDAPMADRCRS
jgi:hypothetical protein